jgi:hypothetical protein
MVVIRKFLHARALVFAMIISLSCTADLFDEPMPVIPFPDYELQVSSYPSLLTDGGYINISNDVGIRGVILYRKNSTTFLAFERNCSYHPNDACATVDVHASTLYMFDSCCGSSFNFDGIPTGGPAWRSLRQYVTFYDAGLGVLTITDEIVD